MATSGGGARANVVLTGFMGTGKSTVGRLVARRLGYRFVDTDEVIESRGRTIAEIFRDDGEDGFRAIEREVAAAVAAAHRQVVATGGRMLLDERNEACLRASGRVFCLVADADAIIARVLRESGGRERPLLSGPDPQARIAALLAERAAGYARFEQVPTDGRSPAEVADDLVARLSATGGASPGRRGR